MQSFEFVLKNEKVKSYNKITLLLELIYVVAIAFYIFKAHELTSVILPLILAVFLAGSLLITYFSKPEFRKNFITQLITDLIAVIAFIIIFKNYWFAFAIILIAVFRILAAKKLKVFFFAEKVRLDFLIPKNIDWEELNNVILKDCILTIDFKDDHLIQVEISPESHTIDETVFNQFCCQQLNAKPPNL